MGLLEFLGLKKSAAKYARMASVDATIAKRDMDACALALRDMEAKLVDMSARLEKRPNANPKTTQNLAITMHRIKTHAGITRQHMQHLDHHIRVLDEHLKSK